MSTIVCQNLVSCFEPEKTTTLKLKVATATAVDFQRKNAATEEDHPPPQFSNWGFLPIKEYSGENNNNNNKESTFYTHPSKPSFSRLSAKSLELCTENLGSETGTDIISDDDSISIFSTSPPRSSNSGGNRKQKSSNSCRSFPPPLTTMSGSSSLQVRRHREDGRLIIEAVEAPFRNSYLTAERSDGRLRLCFSTAETASAASGEGEEEDEEEEVVNNGDECGGEAAVDDESDEPVTENQETIDGEINLEMEMEKFQRLSRCKEGGHGSSKGLCSNWKPALWVATS